jgi:hypothetical protein
LSRVEVGLALELIETFRRGHVSQTIDLSVESCVVSSRLCRDCPETGRRRAGARWHQGPGKHVVLNVTGSDETTSAKDWTGFKGIWNDECSDEFHEAEAEFSMHNGAPQPTGSEGALVVVNVVDYRYVSIGARVAFGIMTGNAFINAQVGFRALKTGETWATKTYDTNVAGAGTKPMGGYSIAIQRIWDDSVDIRVSIEETSPGHNCAGTAVSTAPFVGATIPATTKKVVFDIFRAETVCN